MKTLLLTPEQGWGDQFMFIRYAAEIKKRYPKCRLIVRSEPATLDLFKGADGLDGVVNSQEPFEDFDFHIPLMTVPHFLGTTMANIPEAHCLRIMPDWRRVSIEGNLSRPRVGLVWAGSPSHGKDKARSVTPEMLQPIIDAHPERDFYSLQAGPRAHEFERLRGVTDLAPKIENWTDTAQLLTCMDLLISVDTACVHLAGCVGTPVWMLCPNSPDWRWMLGRDDSPWYPKLRLFRQPKADDWATPIERIKEALK